VPKTLRTSVVAGVAATVALSLLSVALMVVPSYAATRPDTGRRDPSHARAVAALEAVRAALTPPASGSAAPRTDLTLLLRDLRLALPALSPSERTLALGLIGLVVPPPRSSCGGLLDQVVATTHFCVHYSGDQAWAQMTADVLEHVWSDEIGRLGFRSPPVDGDGLFDVYLRDIGSQGYYGACAPAENAAHSTSSCVLDDDFNPAQFGGAPAINSLKVTAAHEFFHVVQFGYDTGEDIWLMEGSAVWAEEQVYPTVNDYVQYLPYSAITHPRTPADYMGLTGADLYYRYGAVLFWKFLSESYRDPAVVRRVWEYADGSRYSLQAVTAALAERGSSFASAFARFGVWNTEPAGSYGDRALFPQPAWWQVTSLSRRHRDTGTHSVVLDHLTNAATLIRPAGRLPKHTRLRVVVNGPLRGRMPQATVQVRRRDGTVRVLGVPLDAGGDGFLKVGFDPRVVVSVVVTLTNASTRMSCGTDSTDRYSCAGQSADDGQTFAVRARVKLP
jgi:hypothetical protein